MSPPSRHRPRHSPRTVGFAARSVALQELRSVHDGKRLAQALEAIQQHSLSDADTKLARHLVLSSLRYHWAAEAAFLPHCQRPPGLQDRLVLVMGCVSLIWLKMPVHAVLGTMVAVAAPKSRGFIHAVLQRVIEQWPESLSETAWQQQADELIASNAPAWCIARWHKHWPSEANDILRGHAVPPRLDLCAKSDEIAADYAADWQARPLWGRGIRHRGHPAQLPGFAEGAWWVQDWAAQWPVWLTRRHLRSDRSVPILDMCAAPGGKTAQIFAHAGANAQVTALDQDRARLETLRDNMRRLGYRPNIVHARAEDWQPDQPFGVIFLDAPCSASGTIRRHPDILLRNHDPGLHHQQTTLLSQAVKWLRPGGILIYSVCSINPGEGWNLLRQQQDALKLQPLPFTAEDHATLATLIRPHRLDAHQLQTLPADQLDIGGMDGFYIGSFRRRA